ncbi:MAG: T9SS type A sorting domain-containing protein [Bacteroidota bacterium]
MNFFKKGRLKFAILFVFAAFNTIAQIDLTMPANRMVYQRNKQNTATIYVGGSFSGQLDRIEARLTRLDGTGNPKTPLDQTEWKNIVSNPSKGNFLASMPDQKGGWYRLEVRGIQNSVQLGEISTIKVGVGEVIVVAGQSNTQGENATDKPNIFYEAKDDRVNCINFQDFSTSKPFKYPVISHIDANSFVGPTGKNSWCWGPLGDLIAKNWDVPVIIFNAAIGDSNITAWRAGAEFSTTEIDQFGRFDFTKGEPFIQLKKTLNYFCSLMGVRTILWQQGETDTGIFQEGTGNTSEIFRDNLKQVVQYSRSYTDKDISWVIAKASLQKLNGQTTYSQRVLDGQQMVINLPNFNTFAGPNTDLIQPSIYERADGVHFWGQGLIDLANGWFNSMNTPNFINNSKPHLAIPPQSASLGNCVNNNQITAQLPQGFTDYEWYTDNYSQVTKNQSITAINNKFMVPYMKDASRKNYIFSPPINFTPAKLVITTDRSTTLCEGQTVNITANTFNNNYNWSNGITTKTIPIKTAGSYSFSVNSQDVYGCVAQASGNFAVTVNALPATPKIISESSPNICEGTSVILRPESSIGNLDPVWSNDTYNTAVSINTKGSYSLKLKDSKNCESLPSNIIEVKVNPNPTKPDIVAGGPTTFCADKFVTVATSPNSNYEWYRNDVIDPSFKTQVVNLSLQGDYKSKVFNEFGCPSAFSDELKISNWALPDSPIITKNGTTEFCAGGSVELLASSSLQNLVWKTTDTGIFSTNTRITINSLSDSKTSSNTTYFATVTDERGCTSLPSEKVLVAIRANPSLPFIDRVGTFTLEAKAPILGLDGTSYDWYFRDQLLNAKEKAIKVNQSGNYFVKAKINYTLPNGNKLECYSGQSSLFDYFEDPSNVFTVFPNPTKDGRVTLETKDDVSGAQILVFTTLGQVLFETTVDVFNNRKLLDMRDLPNGVYKIRLKSGNLMVTKSVIISK